MPLKISDKVHIVSALITAPTDAVKANTNAYFFAELSGERCLKAVSPQKYQPITVQNANIVIINARNISVLAPSNVKNALLTVRSDEQQSIVNAVSVQQIIVSMNTSIIAHTAYEPVSSEL